MPPIDGLDSAFLVVVVGALMSPEVPEMVERRICRTYDLLVNTIVWCTLPLRPLDESIHSID